MPVIGFAAPAHALRLYAIVRGVRQLQYSFRTLGMVLLLPILSPQAPEVMSADLKPATVAGFDRYVAATEARIDAELKRPGAFLYVEGLPEPRRSQVRASLKRGEVYMERLRTRDAAGHEIETPDGLIHHWTGAVFVPGTTLGQTLALVEDYSRHQDIYKPEVVRSKLLERKGNDFKIFYRLRKKKVITVTLDTDHDVHYFLVDETHAYSRSYTTRIQEVANADQPGEREKPVGHDGGFLWRLYSYWRFEQKDGGVYVECESVSLTRDIPWVVSPIVKPFVTDIPKESLQMTMGSTRRALLQEIAATAKTTGR
ncbi:MAG: hypothetical protein LAN62_15290 [Acidobacteriia bacterium]|nr:hypothetical protein [Terriglobia bacterium]